jgi:succinate dehydrogenase hydrophobic anchor subunit
MLTGLMLAVTSLSAPPSLMAQSDTLGALAPRLENLYPERFGPDNEMVVLPLAAADPQRARAVRHSDFYYTRLTIHRVGAILMVPLAVAQYFVGQELYRKGNGAASWVQDAHRPLAAAIAVDYGVNAITGVWNAIDDWHSPGRARRTVHGALMLLAGAGFVATAATAPEREGGVYEGDPARHRRLAISSMAVMGASGLMMLIWK